MRTQKDIDKIRQAMKLLWDVANDCKANVSCTALVAPLDGEKKLGCKPFVSVDVQDYVFSFDTDTGFTCDYRPIDENGEIDFDSRRFDLDHRQVSDFKKPPEEKSPAADQSKQGLSETAHLDFITLEEGNQ